MCVSVPIENIVKAINCNDLNKYTNGFELFM